jgi:hypothetical protein
MFKRPLAWQLTYITLWSFFPEIRPMLLTLPRLLCHYELEAGFLRLWCGKATCAVMTIKRDCHPPAFLRKQEGGSQ